MVLNLHVTVDLRNLGYPLDGFLGGFVSLWIYFGFVFFSDLNKSFLGFEFSNKVFTWFMDGFITILLATSVSTQNGNPGGPNYYKVNSKFL